jgi:hypothetical protein
VPDYEAGVTLRRSKATTIHQCRAGNCLHVSQTVGAGTVYVAVPKAIRNIGTGRIRRYTWTYHVRCFLAEHPEYSLEGLRGYVRHGADAAEDLIPIKSLWDHLECSDYD